MKRWLRDTLFLRLFLLMWATLVVSHMAPRTLGTGDVAERTRINFLAAMSPIGRADM